MILIAVIIAHLSLSILFGSVLARLERLLDVMIECKKKELESWEYEEEEEDEDEEDDGEAWKKG